jgi:hypothetical protein
VIVESDFEKARVFALLLVQGIPAGERTRARLAEKAIEAIDLARVTVDVEALTEDLERSVNVWVGDFKALDQKDDHIEWLDAKRARMVRRFWPRYQQTLRESWGLASIEELDRQTDAILSRIEDPERDGAWDRRGLVVGHVQSGKTANYTGFLCKAADAGYKVLVVLAGMLDDLRTQTQIRLEEGLLGYNKLDKTIVGVGKYDQSPQLDSVTTRASNGDFSKAAARGFSIHPGGAPLLFVVKKNASVLRNLLEWVAFAAKDNPAGRIRKVPLLVIDDEADHASVDTREQARDEDGNLDPDHDPATINKLIRQLLHSFEQKAYVGYTATPFANIFIHEHGVTTDEGPDLFPRSFIVSLPASSDYVGPATLFGSSGPSLIKKVDNEVGPADTFQKWMPPKHKKDHSPFAEHFPESLRQAMRAFVLSCAARRARGQQRDHSTMLVHVTRFTDVQAIVASQIEAELIALRDAVLYGGETHEERRKLQELWEVEFNPTSTAMHQKNPQLKPLTWSQIAPLLPDAVSPVGVRRINGTAKDVLDYHVPRLEGLKVIAIGGDKLSRGLTLHGLSVSYFLRTTKMYDTLMQMGRWFGYRPGYLDLCRIWMPAELQTWFEHISEANEELRQEFDIMAARGGNPDKYGLKVRSHKVMTVTSAVKMRHATTMQVSYVGVNAESTTFHTDLEVRKANKKAADHFINGLGVAETGEPAQERGTKWHRWKGTVLWQGVEASKVTAFLRELRTHEAATSVDSSRLADFIDKQVKQRELTNWTVALLGNGKGKESEIGTHQVRCIERAAKATDGGKVSVRRILSPRDEAIDLDGGSWAAALEQTKLIRTRDPARVGDADPVDEEDDDDIERPSGPGIRAVRPKERGLLLVYPLDAGKLNLTGETPVIGFALSFPASESDVAVPYKVNNVFALEHGSTP